MSPTMWGMLVWPGPSVDSRMSWDRTSLTWINRKSMHLLNAFSFPFLSSSIPPFVHLSSHSSLPPFFFPSLSPCLSVHLSFLLPLLPFLSVCKSNHPSVDPSLPPPHPTLSISSWHWRNVAVHRPMAASLESSSDTLCRSPMHERQICWALRPVWRLLADCALESTWHRNALTPDCPGKEEGEWDE